MADARNGEGPELDPTGTTGQEPPASAPRPERPRPAYGEYAPEGWTWSPEGAEPGSSGSGASGSGAADAAARPASSSAQPAGAGVPESSAGPSAGPVPGVPHNLGAGAAGASAPAAGPRSRPAPGADRAPGAPTGGTRQDSRDPEPYRAAAPEPAPNPQKPLSGGRLADRIVTIALLLLGAYGTLQFAAALFQMQSFVALYAELFEVDDFSVPSWVPTLGTVSALVMLTLFAVTLIFSIQRLRARKITFYIPLIAGAIAFILFFVVLMITVFSVPELVQQMSDPGALNRLMENSSELR
ncbi:hypothetical protein JD276_02235 [Leucobacter sp. CSA1]|uniref:Uncharacterized protein n=1 Tax=Leucobacter chromiisoli TaxID=2796471 RepID=A0A934Q3T1_9MICO|nr:DUF6264 family protein [Leucobacter chromiisoli]MBK0417854.1 hypothetical protein [Leucobacter chromiisoli]